MASRSTTFVATPEVTTRETRAIQKRGRKIPKLRYIGLALVIVWAVIHYFHVQYPQYVMLHHRVQALQTQLTSMQAQQKQLNTQIKDFQNNSYIARYASQHYGLSLPGQVTFDISH